jgi:voltage-gated potassium channel Kch
MSEESTPNPLASARSRTEALAVAVAIVTVIGLAVFGWIRTAEEHHMTLGALDLIEDVQETIFGKEYILVTSKPEESHWAVTVATWLAKVVLAYALIRGAVVLLGRRMRRWWFVNVTRPSGHTVILGAGHRGSVLASRLLSKGHRVVIVEKDEENTELPRLEREGAFVITADALEEQVLLEAGVSRCSRLISLLPDDSKNITAAVTASRLDAPSVVAGVESYEFRSYYRNHPRIRMISFLAMASRKLLTRLACLIAPDVEVRRIAPVLLIEATDPLREECLRAASVALQFFNGERPTVILPHTTSDEKLRFEERYPDAFRVLDLQWLEGDASAAIAENGVPKPDLAIFALSDDARTLEAAERFRIRTGCGSCRECRDAKTPSCKNCRGSGDAPSKDRIIAILRDSGPLLELSRMQEITQIQPLNAFEIALGDGDPLDDAHEKQAENIHESYRAAELAKPDGYHDIKPWLELPEMEKDVNRLAAGHDVVKKALWDSRGDLDADELVAQLAESEHQRWMAVKIMDGWRFSGDPSLRVKSRMLDNLFAPYDRLSEAEQLKDINNVRLTLGLDK